MAKKTSSKPDIAHEHEYQNIPALAAYIDRVGAEQLNFNRFMVKEYKGQYYTEKAIIRIRNGEISCSVKEYAPTDEEVAQIKGALMSVKFPKAIGVRTMNQLLPMLPKDAPVFPFYDRASGDIVMVQQRVEMPDSNRGKAYFPWTYWSDNKWRRMEPDGALPFYKPIKKLKPRIMIHEGAKVAAFVSALLYDKEYEAARMKHPWTNELTDYEHWGIIGGALAPHRANYDEVRKEKPLEVVYVCDNDWPGKNALQEVSKAYGGKLKGIMFDLRWRAGWDMADDMPKELFNGDTYLGPRLEELMHPATYATELAFSGNKGRPTASCRKAFKEEWIHCVQPEVFVHTDYPNHIYTAPEFNNKVAPFSDVDDTARLLKKDNVSKGAIVQYNPSLKSGVYEDSERGRMFNTYCASRIKPRKGDAANWLEFVANLIPDEKDREETLRWCATLIARPDIKMLYGLLLISEMQGVGKGTLGEKILAPLVGWANVSIPGEQDITDSNFNYWAAHKRLAIIHEIYAGHSAKAYNKLKSIITDKNVQVQKKYQAPYMIDNWVHVFACSNSKRALQIAMDDRRWFVPRVVEIKRTPLYWEKFNKWLMMEDGLAIIADWAKVFVTRQNYVMPGQDAPSSVAKQEAIEEGMSEGMLLVSEFIDRYMADNPSPHAIMADTDLVELIRVTNHNGSMNANYLEKPMTIRKVAKHKGWHVNDTRVTMLGRDNAPEWRKLKPGSRLLCLDEKDAKLTPAELSALGLKPIDVGTTYNRLKTV